VVNWKLKDESMHLEAEMNTRRAILAALVAVITSATAYAQMQHEDHEQRGPGTTKHDMQKLKKKMHEKMHQGKADSQSQDADHSAADHGDTAKGDRGPSSAAFRAINQKMHDEMNIIFSGNTDVDFVNGMIPHHRAALDMAKVVLAFGADPEIRRLAEGIIRAQESEIAIMRMWLQRNAH